MARTTALDTTSLHDALPICVIRIFPNRESTICLLGAVLMERHEQWTTGHRYLDMAAYWHWRGERTERASEPAAGASRVAPARSEEHTSELQSLRQLVCRLLL